MSEGRQSQINTVLLSIVVAVSGFIAVSVWNLHGTSEKSLTKIEEHDRQITDIRADIAKIQVQATDMNLKIAKWMASRGIKDEVQTQ